MLQRSGSGALMPEQATKDNSSVIIMKTRIILRINSPLNKFHRHILPDRIIYRIFCSALFSVEHSDNSGRVIYHPFIPNLETGSAVTLADVFNEVSCRQDLLVLTLPFLLSLSLSLSLSLLFTLTTQSPFAIISRRRTAMLF